MGLNGSATTTMVFAERANEDGKAEGQGTEGHRPKAWPEHTLPFADGAQGQGAGPAGSRVRVTRKKMA